MGFERFRAAERPLLIVPDATAAARWEAHWLDREGRSESAVRPPVRTVPDAVDAIWWARRDAGGPRHLISDTQCVALWERVILHSPHGRELISVEAAARAARTGWTLLQQFGIRWQCLEGRLAEHDFAAFLDWCTRYQRRLDEEHWIDRPLAILEMQAGTPSGSYEVAAWGRDALLPATNAFLRRLSAGGELIEMEAGRPHGRVQQLRAADDRAELAAAVDWIAARLETGLTAPLALVAADGRARSVELDSLLEDRLGATAAGNSGVPVWRSFGDPATQYGGIGAALSVLEALSGRGGFGHLSRWLRSPFLTPDGSEALDRRAAFEAAFRQDLWAQRPFVEAYRQGRLAATMRAALPAFTEAVERALQTFERGSRRRFPAEWIVAWERCLQGLGWQPEALGSPPGVLAAWSGASESFASLSAILGTLSATEALAQFRRLLDATSVGRPMPREGVHVVEHADQLGAGYAGIWMTGFTDRLWPATVRLNPLLPLWLQKDHQMPYSTPAIADLASRRILSRVLACAPEIVVSSPALVDDTEFLPSRILDDFEPTDYSDAGSGIRRSYCHSRISERRRTRVKERVPPMQPAEIAGVRALELQSACPLRAFCEIRLRAVPLEVPQRGISRRLRGIIVHRALQLLFSPHVGADTIDVGRLESRAAAAARRAVADAVDQDYPPWDLVAALESARTERAIAALLAWEARRAPFQVVDVERPVQLRIDGWSLKGRLDRVDRLEDGSLVIVDYKTGTLPASAGWFSDRLRFPQMPAYTLSLGDALRAFLVVAVDDGAVEFRAAGSLPEDFPARARPSLSGADWSTQRLRWRTQIAGLLEEFGAGDGRVFVADTTLAEGPYAMLTRVHGPGTDDEAAGRG